MGSCIIMSPDDWKDATTDTFRCKHGSAYGACMQLLLILLSYQVRKPPNEEPERISVFLEDGHKNADDAMLRAKYYKDDTEPVEIPSGARVQVLEEDPFRTRFMRIGGLGLFPKLTTRPLQAADLFVYLVSNLFRPTGSRVFDGVSENLGQFKPHWFSAWNAPKVRLLTRLIEGGEKLNARERENTWKLSRALRCLGFKVHQIPGALVVDGRGLGEALTKEEWNQLLDIKFIQPPLTKLSE